MAFRNMTGTTCGNGQVITFIAEDAIASASTYYQLSTGVCIQLNTINTASTQTYNTDYLVQSYASCAACLAPISANTEQVITYLLNSEISSGTPPTVKTFTPPHPVWTNNQNHAVSQMNMITLGGNGLNS
jgi:hypothetical protein